MFRRMKKQTTALRRRRFERIVVLVDITVVLLQDEPKKLYAAHIFNSVSRILQQCNEHSKFSTLWGYKFFDPSRNPGASRTKIGEVLGGAPMFQQFDSFAPNLVKFGKVLELIVNNYRGYSSEGSRGDCVARAITDVFGMYTWDPLLVSDSSSSDEESKGLLASKDRPGGDGAKSDSSAIMLISSLPTNWRDVNCFFDVPQLVGDSPPDPSAQGLLAKTFSKLRETLRSRNIQVCFVDVPMHQNLWSDERLETLLNPTPARKVILKSLSGLVRTVIASDLLVASPDLLPCNVVWNKMVDLGIDKSSKRSHARVLLNEATPLCEVLWQPFSHTPSSCKGTSVPRPTLLPATDKLDIVLNSVLPKISINMKAASERFFVRQSSRPRATFGGEDRDTFGDKVLQLLDQTAFRSGQPGWQLLLLSLASQNSVCEVRLNKTDDGHSTRAVLEPFTSHTAILTVFEKGIIPANTDLPGSTRVEKLSIMNIEASEELASGEGVNVIKSRRDAAQYHKHEGVIVLPSRKRRKIVCDVDRVNHWQEYWGREGRISAFTELTSKCGTVMSSYIEHGKASQLLQAMVNFLKELRQPSRLNYESARSLAEMDAGEPLSDQACAPPALPDNSDTVVLPGIVSGQNSKALESGDAQLKELNASLAVLEAEVQEESNVAVNVAVPRQEGDLPPSLACDMTLEEATEYISSVGQKIEDFLSSTDVDSLRFAGMLVAESQKGLCVTTMESDDAQQSTGAGDHTRSDLNRRIAAKLRKLLLKSPKKVLAKYKDCAGSTFGTTGAPSMDQKVKEHELQILLRLEMISCNEGRLLEQTAKDQLVKDVCSLLDTIQFHLDGGIFGRKSLSKYCDRLLVSRYKTSIPSTISKIFSMMELDGYSEPARPNFDSESLQEIGGNEESRTEDLFGEACESQDAVSWSEKISSSTRSEKGLADSRGQVQCQVAEKGQVKKGSYHFASHASTLMRKFKSGRRHISTHAKQSKGRGKQRVLVNDSPVKIVCQTPAPAIAPSSRWADEVTQQSTLASPMDFIACSPTHESVSVEQVRYVVEGTPLVKRRLTLSGVGKENLAGSDIGLDEMLTDIDRASNAVPGISATFPSKMSRRPFAPGPSAKQGVVDGHLSFSALLNSVVPILPRMEEVGNLGSNLGNRPLNDGDIDDDDIEDDDDDEYGIPSTPFNFTASDDSRSSLQTSQSERPDCHRRLDLFADENISRDGFSLHSSPTVKSIRSFRPAGLADARAGEVPSLALDTNMAGNGGSPEGTQLPAHHIDFRSNAESNPVTRCIVHQKDLRKDFCPKDVTLGKLAKGVLDLSARMPRSPLGAISINSAQHSPMKQYPSIELCSVSDAAARNDPGGNAEVQYASATVDDKENQCGVNRERSTNLRAGVRERKTRSRTLLEQNTLLDQNMARRQTVNTKRRKGRIR